jgi:phosphatidylinositol alpha-1,6-mannosyltransferase
MKAWLLTNAPSPYQIEFLEALNARAEIELIVRFMQSSFRNEVPQNLRFASKVLEGYGLSKRRDELRVHPDALREVWVGDFDAYILSGLYTSPTFLLSVMLLWLRGKPFCLWLERPSEFNRKDIPILKRIARWPFAVFRFALLRLLFAMTDAVICVGSAAKSAYVQMGLIERKAFVIPYCIDHTRYNVDTQRRDEKRSELKVEQKVVFLTSCQLIYRKGVDFLISSYMQVSELFPGKTALWILGDGPEKTNLQNLSENCRDGEITFMGHQHQVELPSIFRSADVFVFPTRHDGWGVVVNEAVASGLPIIATNEAGATYDLVIENENGYRIGIDDVSQLTRCMIALVSDPEKRMQFGRRSCEIAASVSVKHGVEVFHSELRKITTKDQS